MRIYAEIMHKPIDNRFVLAYNALNNKHSTTGGYIMVNRNTIDTCIWNIKKVLMEKYGCTAADREIAPLVWYINTGRASTLFLEKLINAKAYMIARRLHAGGSDMEIIDRIKSYVG